MSETESPAAEPVCSARGCQRPAVWALRWNNPRLHTPERRKTWLACDEHRATLAEFLGARSFLRELEALRDDEGSGPGMDVTP